MVASKPVLNCTSFMIENHTNKAIAYLLFHLNLTAMLVMMVQNIVAVLVLRNRIKKRPETNFKTFFVFLFIVDLIFAIVSQIRDINYVWRESLPKGNKYLKFIRFYRFAEGYFLALRSTMIVQVLIYYILFKKSPYYSEKMSSRATYICAVLCLLCSVTVLGDGLLHSWKKCRKYSKFFPLVFSLTKCIENNN